MANNNAGALKYWINRTIPDNVRMFAQVTLRNGEEIISERPLDRIAVGLEDTYNPDQVLDRIKMFSAARHFEINRDKMS